MKREMVYRGLKYILYLILIVILFYIIRQASLLSIDGHHDGTVFIPANIVARGGVLFRDANTYYGPLLVFVQALFLKIFGYNMAALRLSTVIFYVGAFIVYFHIFKRVLPRYMVIFSEIILLFVAPYWMTTFHAWSSVYTLTTTLGIIYFTLLAIEKEKLLWAMLAGVFSAWTFLFRTPVGVVFILASAIFWIGIAFFKLRGKTYHWAAAYFAGLFAGMLPFLILFVIQGTLAVWWNNCVSYTFGMLGRLFRAKSAGIGLVNYRTLTIQTSAVIATQLIEIPPSISKLFQDLFPINNSGIFIILPVSTLILFFYLIYKIIKQGIYKENIIRWKEKILIFVILWFSLASWHQYYGVSEIRHWYWGGFPMMGVLTMLLYYLCRQLEGKWHSVITILLLLTLSATTLYERYSYYKERKERYIYEIEKEECAELEGIFLSAEQSRFYKDYCEVMESLKETHPERGIRNDSFCELLGGLGYDENNIIDKSKAPIIVSNSNNAEDYPEYFMAVELIQDYPEQELDPQVFKIRIWLPNNW